MNTSIETIKGKLPFPSIGEIDGASTKECPGLDALGLSSDEVARAENLDTRAAIQFQGGAMMSPLESLQSLLVFFFKKKSNCARAFLKQDR